MLHFSCLLLVHLTLGSELTFIGRQETLNFQYTFWRPSGLNQYQHTVKPYVADGQNTTPMPHDSCLISNTWRRVWPACSGITWTAEGPSNLYVVKVCIYFSFKINCLKWEFQLYEYKREISWPNMMQLIFFYNTWVGGGQMPSHGNYEQKNWRWIGWGWKENTWHMQKRQFIVLGNKKLTFTCHKLPHPKLW